MTRSRLALIAVLAGAAAGVAPGCGCGHPTYQRPYAAPTAAAIEAALAARRARARSFNHTSKMDFWTGEDRVKTRVYVMGERGSKIRMNALDPAGGAVLADLACDGTRFAYKDFQRECQLGGPCTEDSIAALLHVRLSPDDFVLLALAQPPVLPGASASSVTWDAGRGAEILERALSDGRRQRLVLDARSGPTWDVVEATVWSATGEVESRVRQGDFSLVTGADGATLRLARRLRFEQPSIDASIDVTWDERQLNPALAATKFAMTIPPGLPECGHRRRGVAPAPLP